MQRQQRRCRRSHPGTGVASRANPTSGDGQVTLRRVNVFVTGGTGYLGAPLIRRYGFSITPPLRASRAARRSASAARSHRPRGRARSPHVRADSRRLRRVRAARRRAPPEPGQGGASPPHRSRVGARVHSRGVSGWRPALRLRHRRAACATIMKADQPRGRGGSGVARNRNAATILRLAGLGWGTPTSCTNVCNRRPSARSCGRPGTSPTTCGRRRRRATLARRARATTEWSRVMRR